MKNISITELDKNFTNNGSNPILLFEIIEKNQKYPHKFKLYYHPVIWEKSCPFSVVGVNNDWDCRYESINQAKYYLRKQYFGLKWVESKYIKFNIQNKELFHVETENGDYITNNPNLNVCKIIASLRKENGEPFNGGSSKDIKYYANLFKSSTLFLKMLIEVRDYLSQNSDNHIDILKKIDLVTQGFTE